MIDHDSHVHTAFSTDSDEPMEQMVKQAVRAGLHGITFTDHMDYNFPQAFNQDDTDPAPFTFDLEQYLAQIGRLEKIYGSQVRIYRGVELGLKRDAVERNMALSRDSRLDYIIGSIHLVDDIDPYFPQYWDTFGEKAGITAYFETALQNVQDARVPIDTFGHLDYIVRYAPSGNRFYSYRMYAELIDEILRVIVTRGISLEVNTSGYKNGGTMPNPNEDIIRRYRELGGESVTFGSDAHTAGLLAARFADAETIVRNAGFDHYVTFTGHKPTFHKFES